VQDMFVNPHDPTQLIDGLSSRVLKDLMVDKTPDISKILAFFDGAFDAKQAEAQGCIIPKRVRCVHRLCNCWVFTCVVSVSPSLCTGRGRLV
jgi:hypothetical protein